MGEPVADPYTCPKCRMKSLRPAADSAIECATCRHKVPIVNQIPRFVSSDNYTGSFGYQWNIHSKTQLDRINGLNISRDRVFRQSRWTPEELKGKWVAECGSGAGRFTQILCETGAHVCSFDYSSAVEANAKNNAHYPNLRLCQASIFEAPFPKESFDYVVCFGVIQHTPDPALAIQKMVELVKPGGKFCFDVYASPISYLHPRHLLRPFTKRMDKDRLYRWVKFAVPLLLPLSTALHRVPWIGQLLARLIPVANWRANIHLPDEKMYLEWAILDTFDWLSPAYEYPQSRGSLQSILGKLDVHFEIRRERGLYIISGSKLHPKTAA